MTPRVHRRFMVGLVALAAGLAGCGGSSSSQTSPLKDAQVYYLSIGDSYAAGFQPTAPGQGHDTDNGFADQLPALAAKKGYDLVLVDLGCDGATTSSLVAATGCATTPVHGQAYPHQTQAAAAETFLREHRGRVSLVTVSIGGNDITRCAESTNPITCVGGAIDSIKRNLGTFLPALRSAAGPDVRIVGLTYPDVLLGEYLSSAPADKTLAGLSATAFKALVNPALQAQYDAVSGTFVDVTAATGAYTPFAQTTDLPPYGTIPTAVAQICELTYFCQYQDVHPKTVGYTKIAGLVVAALPALSVGEGAMHAP